MLLPVQQCGKGMNLDLLPSELAPEIWSDASNVRFRNGFATRRKGITEAYSALTATPYWLGCFNTATKRFLVEASTATVHVDDGSTSTDISPAVAPTGNRDDRWTGVNFNGVLVMNNGVNDPMFWNGNTATDLAALTGWTAGTKADSISAIKYYLVAIAPTIGGTKFPYRLMWSSAADPGAIPTAWTAAATNDAGSRDLLGVGQLIDALPMGETLIVYGQEGRYAMRWIGGDQVMETQRLPGKDGLLARGCVASTPIGHVFLANGDVLLHAGAEATSIADGVVRKWLSENMDSTNGARSFVCLNPQETEVWVCFPSTGQNDCDTVLAWNWKDKSWAKFSVPNLTYGAAGLVSSALSATTYNALTSSITYDTITTTYNQNEASSNEARLIVATSTPKVGLANAGSLDFGSRVSWYLERCCIPLSTNADMVLEIRGMRPRLDATVGTAVTVKLSTAMNQDDSPTFPNSTTYTQGTTNWVNQFTKAGRYGSVRIQGSDDQIVGIRSYQLDVTESGGRF